MVVLVETIAFERDSDRAEYFVDLSLAGRDASFSGGATFSLAGALGEGVFAERLHPLEVVFARVTGVFVGWHIALKCRGLTAMLLK